MSAYVRSPAFRLSICLHVAPKGARPRRSGAGTDARELGKKKGRARHKRRAHAAESPYGQVKGNLEFRRLMRRGGVKK